MTHTPASGPFAPITTPPILFAATRNGVWLDCAYADVTGAAQSSVTQLAVSMAAQKVLLAFISIPSAEKLRREWHEKGTKTKGGLHGCGTRLSSTINRISPRSDWA